MTKLTYQRSVRFQDCDTAGIVFYPRYIEMLTDILDEWAAAHFNYDWITPPAARPQLLPTAVDLRFLLPSRLGDVLAFTLSLSERSARALHFDCNIASGEEQRVQIQLVLGWFRPGPPAEQIELPPLVSAS